MASELIDTIRSLVALMREETEILRGGGRTAAVEEIAAAKLRLTASLETQIAQAERERPDWRSRLADEDQAALREATDALRQVAADNAEVLERQISLSREILDAIAAEAKRLSGSRSQTYCARGEVFRVDAPTPISVNTSL